METIIAILFIGLILFILGALVYQKGKMMGSYSDHSEKHSFYDNHGNAYDIVKLGGTKLFMKWPEEVNQWNKLDFNQKKGLVDESERKVAAKKLQKVIISGAIGYIAVDNTLRSATVILNKMNNEKSYDR